MSQDSYLFGTFSHYEDAIYYDHAYKRRRSDTQFYGELAAEHGTPVLELGVGTGRVALSILRRGLDVVGVDPSAPMLERAREKADRLPQSSGRLELIRGDLRSVRIPQTFDRIISPFNVWMHLYTREDFERACQTVKRHLSPDGIFIFDVLNPDPAALARNPRKVYRGRSFKHPKTGDTHDYAESFRYGAIDQVQQIFMFSQPQGKPEQAVTMEVAHRQYFPQEMDALLHYNGFEVLEKWGSFEREPFDSDSESQILMVRPLRE